MPVFLALRKDRKLWIKQDGNNVDEKRFRKNARKILNACISLGPVYIKFGQWLSSRADILPQPYLEELSKLQDSVPAVPFEKVRPIIEKDIGKIEEKFDDLDQNSLSGASLGQVHLATKNGQQVIVKVKRPGIEKQVERDLKVLMKIIPFAMKFVDPNLRFSIIPIMKQFGESIHEEMDYSKESENLKKIKKNMEPYDRVVIPEVHDDYSTKNVLTMEYIPGVKVTKVRGGHFQFRGNKGVEETDRATGRTGHTVLIISIQFHDPVTAGNRVEVQCHAGINDGRLHRGNHARGDLVMRVSGAKGNGEVTERDPIAQVLVFKFKDRLGGSTGDAEGLSIGDIACLATGRKARCQGCIQDMPGTASQVNHATSQVRRCQAKTGSRKCRNDRVCNLVEGTRVGKINGHITCEGRIHIRVIQFKGYWRIRSLGNREGFSIA